MFAVAFVLGLMPESDVDERSKARGQSVAVVGELPTAAGGSQTVPFLPPDCRCRPGTLFQWSSAPNVTGGPDLSAPLVTDRPDFTEASVTVGLGVTQLEMGYTYAYDTDELTASHSYGEPLLRQGIFADWLELRVALFPTQEWERDGDVRDRHAGTEDMYFGFKVALTPQAGWLPEMALIPQLNLPTGSRAFSSETVEPGLNWVYGWEVSDFISTGGSSQANRRVDDAEHTYLEIAQSWTVGYSLTDRLGAFTECFALFPSGADVALPEYYFDCGFTYLINDNIQYDVRYGVGLNDAAVDYFVGTGLSVRFL
ncbi:MAG: transporter [Planctomycetales bacterium]|nr:transporter [Planctomycetales bacterium]